jgi:ADP-ribose pyrophosphatase
VAIIGLQVDREERVGTGGFLFIRRCTLRSKHDDGSLSAAYACDFVVRPMGLDAIGVAVYTRARGPVEVLVRDCMRPPLLLGRGDGPTPLPDPRPYVLSPEVVAGVVEAGDRGEDGLRRRAAAEVHEEAGFEVAPDRVVLLGAGSFLSPGLTAEKMFFAAVEVVDPDDVSTPDGDGSAMEEGAVCRWLPLADAIAACVAGDIEDIKTEIALRRLRDHLAD